MAGLRLRLYKAARIHRGEERRTVGFALIYLMISMITGLLSSGGDVLFLQHQTTWAELRLAALIQEIQQGLAGGGDDLVVDAQNINTVLAGPLLGVGALVLVGLGILYVGWTDRRDKERIFLGGMAAALAVSLLLSLGLFVPVLQQVFPYFYSLIYVLRFAGGVFLLMLFWDITGLYFDVRQGKRLYPLMAAAGVAGYTAGTLLVTPLLIYFPPAVLFLVIGGLAAASYAFFRGMAGAVRPLWVSRTRSVSFRESLASGVSFFRHNRFLRVLALSTLLFGIAGGFIMFTYNKVVSGLADTSRGTAHLIALQRAGASVLQAVIVTKVLSQSALGGRLRSHFVMQTAVLFLGFAAFLLSMVGVADFTRQIAIALMSPAAMAAFAIIPAEFRGRSMAAVNLVVAPAGMVLASAAVFVLESFFALGVFLGLIALFLTARLLMNLWVNRAYLDTLTAGTKDAGDFDAASLFEEAGALLQDEKALAVWMEKLEGQDESVKLLIWGRLAAQVKTRGEFLRLEPYAPPLQGRRGSLWLRLMSRFDLTGAVPILTDLSEMDGEVRREGLRIIRDNPSVPEDLRQGYHRQREEVLQALDGEEWETLAGGKAEILERELEAGQPGMVEAVLRASSRVSELSGEDREKGLFLLDAALRYPCSAFQGIYFTLLEDPDRRPLALTALEGVAELDKNQWLRAYREAELGIKLALQDLLAAHLSSGGLRWYWDFLAGELEAVLGTEEDFYTALGRREDYLLLNGLFRLALSFQEEVPLRLRNRGKDLMDRLERYKGELLALKGRSFPEEFPYEPLFRRWVDQFDGLFLDLLMAAAGFRFRDSEQRLRYSLLIRDFQPGVTAVRTKVLELLDTVLEKREQAALGLFLEPLTREERLVRLRSAVRRPEASWEGFFRSGRRIREPGPWKERLLQSALAVLSDGSAS